MRECRITTRPPSSLHLGKPNDPAQQPAHAGLALESGEASVAWPVCCSTLFGASPTRQNSDGLAPSKPPPRSCTNRSASGLGIALPTTSAFQPAGGGHGTPSRASCAF